MRGPRGPGLLRRLALRAAELLFPSRCVGCGAAGDWLCPDCLARIQPLPPNAAPGAGRVLRPLSGVRAAARYHEPLRRAIHRFKYSGLRALAPPLGKILIANWQQSPWPVDVILPVPLHPARYAERGYNQSALLARELGRGVSIAVDEALLLRAVRTRTQVGLGPRERWENVRGAFRCADEGRLAGKSVLLVDDVLTTGATMQSCGRTLLAAGARVVWGLTLAQE